MYLYFLFNFFSINFLGKSEKPYCSKPNHFSFWARSTSADASEVETWICWFKWWFTGWWNESNAQVGKFWCYHWIDIFLGCIAMFLSLLIRSNEVRVYDIIKMSQVYRKEFWFFLCYFCFRSFIFSSWHPVQKLPADGIYFLVVKFTVIKSGSFEKPKIGMFMVKHWLNLCWSQNLKWLV